MTHPAVFPSTWSPQTGDEECRDVINVFRGRITYHKESGPMAYTATQESWDDWVKKNRAERVS